MSGARQAHTASMANSFCSTRIFIFFGIRRSAGPEPVSTDSAMVTNMIPKKCIEVPKGGRVARYLALLDLSFLSHTAFRAGVYSLSTKRFRLFYRMDSVV